MVGCSALGYGISGVVVVRLPNRIRDTAPNGEYGTAKRVRSLLSFSAEGCSGLS